MKFVIPERTSSLQHSMELSLERCLFSRIVSLIDILGSRLKSKRGWCALHWSISSVYREVAKTSLRPMWRWLQCPGSKSHYNDTQWGRGHARDMLPMQNTQSCWRVEYHSNRELWSTRLFRAWTRIFLYSAELEDIFLYAWRGSGKGFGLAVNYRIAGTSQSRCCGYKRMRLQRKGSEPVMMSMLSLAFFSSLRELSTSIRFPGSGAENKKVRRMNGSVIVFVPL